VKLPVDTSAIAFLCAMPPEPVVDFETKRPRADENGEPLYVIQLLAMGDGSADLLAVKVPGTPSQAIRQGHPVKVSGLIAQPWTMNDRAGVAFRAARVEPAVAQAKASYPEGRRCRSDREGGDRVRGSGPGSPPPTRPGASTPGPLHQEVEPMMRLDPTHVRYPAALDEPDCPACATGWHTRCLYPDLADDGDGELVERCCDGLLIARRRRPLWTR
jgi:hypothetical protein